MKKFFCSLLIMVMTVILMGGYVMAAKPEDEIFNETGFPIAKEKVTLEFVVQTHALHGDFNQMEILKELEEKTNVHIEWKQIPENGFNQAKNLMLVSNDLPDAFFGPGLTDEDILIYGSRGIFTPLNELIIEYIPNLNEIFDKRPQYKSLVTAPDGNIYSLPHGEELPIFVTNHNIYINKVWLDKLGLEIPETTEEFYQVLKAFKEEDPNGNGKADEIPLSFLYGNPENGMASYFGPFGIIDEHTETDGHLFITEDNKVVFAPMQEGFKEGIKYLHRLYSEGLIDQEVFTHDWSQYIAKGKEGVYGVFSAWREHLVVGQVKNKNYTTFKPLKGPDGYRLYDRKGSPVNRNYFTITSSNKYPKITARYIDLFYDLIIGTQLSYGPIGNEKRDMFDKKAWEEEGVLRWHPIPEGMNFGEFRNGDCPGNISPHIILKEQINGNPLENLYLWQERIDQVQKYIPYLEKRDYPNVFLELEVQEKLATLRTDIMDYVTSKTAEWVIKGGVDEQWDSYLKQLEKMGIEEYMSYYREAYEAYK